MHTANFETTASEAISRRRDSSTHNDKRRRPQLLRAAATEPSISASNASRSALASPKPTHRATDILSRVAVFSAAAVEFLTDSTSQDLHAIGQSIVQPPSPGGNLSLVATQDNIVDRSIHRSLIP